MLTRILIKPRVSCAYIVTIFAIKIVRAVERNVWVADHSRVVEEVGASGVREKPVEENDVSLFGYDRGKLFMIVHVWDVASVDGRVEAFGMIVQVLDNT